ncbi:class I SAM-dependent methyltransferase [Kibdelosporangium phytohabitans]|uniref:class I SAM-dependent methyltransferase n=1 Tax=Kibdelosporangium phytohabitans TaxID=860235 RepID=UPI0019DBB8B8|nr:class I SAM-dependent methyltransferase [Kibdelosporangium phytohabitans]MBE1462025.1 SAM-dependent methyltransferase [Kibdelosporangium phytohabitans]
MTSTAAEAWLRRWDAQQERYIADREERFSVLCDIVETALADVAWPVILDLGCGPGSLAGRLRDRLPRATIIGIDSDPLLLGLARSHYGDGITWVDADLSGDGWLAEVPPAVHAAVSTTALHWLPQREVAQLYRAVGELMPPGGVFVNGDHMGPGDEGLGDLAAAIRDRRAARVGVEQNEEWGAWWDAATSSPELADLVKARAERLVHKERHAENTLSVRAHADLLRAGGFGSVAPLWQVGDDHILVAVKR